MQELQIDPEFETFLPAATAEEDALLRQSIIDEGCRDPIILWANHDVIVDGHRRYAICRELGEPFKTLSLNFEGGRASVLQWMFDNQAGRRNLTREKLSYIRGKIYQESKKQERGGGDRKSDDATQENQSGKSYHFDSGASKTSETVAEQFGVSEKTIRNDGKFAEAVDAAPPSVKDAVLSGKVKASTKDLEALATTTDADRKAAVEAIESGEAKTLKAALATPTAVVEDEPEPPPEPVPDTIEERIKRHNAELDSIARNIKGFFKHHDAPIGPWFDGPRYDLVQSQLDSAAASVRAVKAHAGCPICDAKGCKRCKGSGFMPKNDWEMSQWKGEV